jgi:UDP-N-acetylglucosamine 1-carboxyvinyltransferase
VDQFLIEGGRPLRGEIAVGGSKNAALPMLAAALLADGRTLLRNVPRLRDVDSMLALMGSMGVRSQRDEHTVALDCSSLESLEAPYDLVRKMRASIYVLGPLLARFGHARVSLPGGCAWGPRPIDLHLKGLQALGAEIELRHGYVEARAQRLRGSRIVLDVVSVGATANLLMAASLAEGTTVIENAAREPHIIVLGEMLQAMGAHVSGLGTHRIEVVGQRTLRGVEVRNRPDYIEAGTLAVAAAITDGDLLLTSFPLDDCRPSLALLQEAGGWVEETARDPGGMAQVRIRRSPGGLRAISLTTAPHPGFPTDMQAQMMALLTVAEGTSLITEGIYADRFSHVPELRRMGAEIALRGNVAVVQGRPGLAGAPVMATDLRASAAMVLAALVAEGETRIRRVYHIDRGYEAIEKKLAQVGARIQRVQE